VDAKQNCWEFKNCGREPGGRNVGILRACPAAIESRLDGANGGKNAGRSCWVVSGTVCGGQLQDSISEKIKDCLDCDFFSSVLTEERESFVHSQELLDLL